MCCTCSGAEGGIGNNCTGGCLSESRLEREHSYQTINHFVTEASTTAS